MLRLPDFLEALFDKEEVVSVAKDYVFAILRADLLNIFQMPFSIVIGRNYPLVLSSLVKVYVVKEGDSPTDEVEFFIRLFLKELRLDLVKLTSSEKLEYGPQLIFLSFLEVAVLNVCFKVLH